MTVREFFIDTLTKMGKTPDEAKEIMYNALKDPLLGDLRGRWDDPANSYPSFVLEIAWMTVEEYIK